LRRAPRIVPPRDSLDYAGDWRACAAVAGDQLINGETVRGRGLCPRVPLAEGSRPSRERDSVRGLGPEPLDGARHRLDIIWRAVFDRIFRDMPQHCPRPGDDSGQAEGEVLQEL